ncbi:30S ribosomal protein S2 [Gemmata obscuriglobus]|uniref:30S ribosomal protein S2 n=1 Tax=Gemmata obscuriglobus TaxID=114 RepID=UPI003AAE2542
MSRGRWGGSDIGPESAEVDWTIFLCQLYYELRVVPRGATATRPTRSVPPRTVLGANLSSAWGCARHAEHSRDRCEVLEGVPVALVDVKVLLEAGVHYGHRASRWNPKMRPYIYGKRNLIHIIDPARNRARAAPRLPLPLSGGRQGRAGDVRRHQAAGEGDR